MKPSPDRDSKLGSKDFINSHKEHGDGSNNSIDASPYHSLTKQKGSAKDIAVNPEASVKVETPGRKFKYFKKIDENLEKKNRRRDYL